MSMAFVLKDIIKTTYKELFTVKFQHSGYGLLRSKFVADSIRVEPDVAGRELFADHSIGYRFFNDTLICFIRTQPLAPPAADPKAPYIKFPGNVLIRFLINVSADFLDKTNVVPAGAKQVYHFSNQANAGTGGFISVHTDTIGVNNDDLKNVTVVNPGSACFGVIDIFSNGAVNANYELFTSSATQQLRSPAFVIPFKSKI
jgi:hypothetical protein